MSNPKVVIVLSGKRKSGKDHIAEILNKLIPKKVFLRISEPIKRQFTKENDLDYEKSLTASEYKESFRLQMLKWSEDVRKSDANIFLRQAIKDQEAEKFPVWILVDARRTCDLEYFNDDPAFVDTVKYFVRIRSSHETRSKRGWTFTPGIDDQETECGLDNWTNWSLVLDNEDLTESQVAQAFQDIIDHCHKVTS